MGQVYTFATLYAPNAQQLSFIDTVLDSLVGFRERRLVLGGDFNVSPNPRIDTSSSHSMHAFCLLEAFPQVPAETHSLVDCWRVMHVSEKDYSYYATVHGVYTRINLLLVDQSSLHLLADSSIDQITLSDHAPVSITLDLPHVASRSWLWRLNNNLLDNPSVVSGIEETLSHYWVYFGRAIRQVHFSHGVLR